MLNCSASSEPALWQKLDRIWFKQHKKRSYRSRKPLPGELAALGRGDAPSSDYLILVCQTEPGRRLRLPMLCAGSPMTSEKLIHAYFDTVLQARLERRQYFCFDDLQERLISLGGRPW